MIPQISIAQEHTNVQSDKKVNRKLYENFIREKLRISPEDLPKLQRNSALWQQMVKQWGSNSNKINDKSNSILSSTNEVGVSTGSEIESEIHAAINPADPSNIVVSPIGQTGGLTVPIYYTKDFGKTWKRSNVELGPKESGSFVVGGGDPVFAFDASGKLYFSWINVYLTISDFSKQYADMYWAYSTDGGETWQREENDKIGGSVIQGQNAEEFFDKQWLVVDNTESQFKGNLYCAMLHADGEDTRIGLRTKSADSNKFTDTTLRPKTSFAFNQFSCIDVAPDGSVNVVFFGSRKGMTADDMAFYHLRSTDGGKSFDSENTISSVIHPRFSSGFDSVTTTGILVSRIMPCPQFSIDKSSGKHRGRMYAVWSAFGTNEDNKRGLDIFLTYSDDNGKTWSPPRPINDNTENLTSDQFYPSLSVNENGVVIVTWYDRRNDTTNKLTEFFMTYSFDGGESFIKNFAVSGAATDFSTVGNSNNGFGIGEYNQTVSTKDFAIPVWCDGRENDGNLNIYAAFVPISPSTSAEDVYDISLISENVSLSTPYPNPSSTSDNLSVDYFVKSECNVFIEIVSVEGLSVKTLKNGFSTSGKHTLQIDTKDLVSGGYLCKIKTPDGSVVRKFTIAK